MVKSTHRYYSFHRPIVFILLIVLIQVLIGQDNFKLSGEIRDARTGELINFASISVDQARYGTLSQAGHFQLILPKGNHTLKISHLGYKTLVQTINLDSNLSLKLVLSEEVVELDEVIISSDGRDPAYAIIRQAIDNKKKNAAPFPQFEYKAYTKAQFGFQEGFDLDSMLKVFQATQKRRDSQEESESVEDLLPSNILFLSENISRMYIKAPNKVKEEILSTRISGASDQFSPLGNTFNRFDIYENRVFQGEIAERGIISPIADNAFFFYTYKLIGQIKENGQRFYKILVIPKRLHDPVFQGLVYIADSSYSVQKLDLFVSKKQAIQVVDTLRIKQEYGWIANAWLPLSTRTHMAFSLNLMIFKFPLEGTFTSLLSDYKVGANSDEKKFGMEQISFVDSALIKDRLWWDSIRPLPLSVEESLDYNFKDSVEKVHNSPEYLDSLTAAQKFDFLDIIVGGRYTNYRKRTSWNLLGLAMNSGFNAIEGAYITQGLDRIWNREQGRSIQLGYRLRYGFANRVFGAKLALDISANPTKNESWGIAAGNFVQQFSRPDQISAATNTFFATFFKRSYIRLYRKQFVESYYSRELFNGFTLSLNGRFEDRSPLSNSSDYSFFFKDRMYDENLLIPSHKALITELRLTFKPFNKFMSLPDTKINLGSGWPLFEFHYVKGWANGIDYADFDRVKVSASGNVSFALLGNSRWRASIGKTLNDARLFIPDLFHYQGNEHYLHSGSFDVFFLMPYYEFSSKAPFVEAHLEHAFGGFIFNKIPGIRRLKLSEFAGIHLLAQEGRVPYVELNVGLEKKILKIIPLRIDFNMRLAGKTRGEKYGVKLYDPGLLGGNGSVALTF